MKDTQKSAKSTTGRASMGFTDEQRAAMRERARELKAAARRGPRAGKADGESSQKFTTRYATFGFSDKAKLGEGAMWPTAFALKELTAADGARIGALVKKAVS